MKNIKKLLSVMLCLALLFTFAVAASAEEEEVIPPAGPVDCEIPGDLEYTFETDEAASAGVVFQWTADKAGEIGVRRQTESYVTTVNVNGEPAVIGNEGYVVAVGDLVEITVLGFGSGSVVVPVSFQAAGSAPSGPVGSASNPEILTQIGDYTKTLDSGDYYYQYTAPVSGELTITTTGDGTHCMETYINGNTSRIYSNWDNNGEFIMMNVSAGDVVTIKVYFDFGAAGTMGFSLALPGAENVTPAPTPDPGTGTNPGTNPGTGDAIASVLSVLCVSGMGLTAVISKKK